MSGRTYIQATGCHVLKCSQNTWTRSFFFVPGYTATHLFSAVTLAVLTSGSMGFDSLLEAPSRGQSRKCSLWTPCRWLQFSARDVAVCVETPDVFNKTATMTGALTACQIKQSMPGKIPPRSSRITCCCVAWSNGAFKRLFSMHEMHWGISLPANFSEGTEEKKASAFSFNQIFSGLAQRTTSSLPDLFNQLQQPR